MQVAIGARRRSGNAAAGRRRELASSVIAVSGARLSLSASAKSNTKGAPLAPSIGGAEDQVEFVDETSARNPPSANAPTLDQQALHAELAIEDVQRQREVDDSPQAGEMPKSGTLSVSTTIGSPPMSERPAPSTCRARRARRRKSSHHAAQSSFRAEMSQIETPQDRACPWQTRTVTRRSPSRRRRARHGSSRTERAGALETPGHGCGRRGSSASRQMT